MLILVLALEAEDEALGSFKQGGGIMEAVAKCVVVTLADLQNVVSLRHLGAKS